jgi:hypothetical protein
MELTRSSGAITAPARQVISLEFLTEALAVAGLVEWLVGRTITRGAIFMPKPPVVVVIYQALTWLGQFALALTGVLALATLAWLVWDKRGVARGALSALLAIIGIASIVLIFVQPNAWSALTSHLLTLAALFIVGWHAQDKRVWVILSASFVLGELYQVSGALVNILQVRDSFSLTNTLFNAGELLVVVSAGVWWWLFARKHMSVQAGVIAAIPALAFLVFYNFNPSMVGIISIWSFGASLYLPGIAYAAALWLTTATLVVTMRGNPDVMRVILLMTAMGYAPQLSTHVLLGLIALILLAPVKRTEVAI